MQLLTLAASRKLKWASEFKAFQKISMPRTLEIRLEKIGRAHILFYPPPSLFGGGDQVPGHAFIADFKHPKHQEGGRGLGDEFSPIS